VFKDILVPLLMGDIPSPALRAGCALARVGGGRVTALVGVSQAAPVAEAWAYYPAGVYQSMRDCAAATSQAMADAAEDCLIAESVPYRIHQAQEYWSTPAELCIEPARHSDLVVVGTVAGDQREARERLAASVLVASGRPVLLVPATCARAPGFDKAVVAWKSSRESARALHDAMPWLRRMRSVDLLIVDEEPASSRCESLDALLIGHLERNEVSARVIRRSAPTAQVGSIIDLHAQETAADLLVAGGYSHSRFREQILGGATRFLMAHASVPTLLSH
jgi:nucleotide-binding universal stress UspA family protein